MSSMFKGKKDDGEGRLHRQPFNWEAIANGLEADASRVLNAVPLRAIVTERNGELLVNGRYSQALNDYARYEGLDTTLDLLARNGRAVQARRVTPF